MKEVALADDQSEPATFTACVATIVELALEEVPRPAPGQNPATGWAVSLWLGGMGLGLVPVADAATFSWPGPWVGRVRPVGPRIVGMAHTSSSTQVLSIHSACVLGVVINAAIRTARVVRLLDGGALVRGTARSIGDDRGNFAGRDDDVRDCCLRVTTDAGFEVFRPVAELIAEVGSGMFCLE